MRFSKMNV